MTDEYGKRESGVTAFSDQMPHQLTTCGRFRTDMLDIKTVYFQRTQITISRNGAGLFRPKLLVFTK